MLSTTQAAPRGCDSSVPSLLRSARLTAQLQPPFLSCTATSWPGGHKNLHALPPSSGGSAGLASSTAPKHFCSHCGGLCILSCRNPSNTAGRGGGERTNRSRGVLAASIAWFGLVSAAWPLPLPRVLPLGDPPFLLTASPATRPPPLPLLPPPSLLLSLRRVRAHPSGCRPRLQRQTPHRCHLLRQPRPGHSRAPWGCLRPPHSPAWCFGGGSSFVPSSSSSPGARQGSSDAVPHAGFVFQLTAPSRRCRMLRAVPLPPGYSHTPWAWQSWARSCCSSRFPLEISRPLAPAASSPLAGSC